MTERSHRQEKPTTEELELNKETVQDLTEGESEKALNVVPIRPMPPVASTRPEVPKVLNQETTSGV